MHNMARLVAAFLTCHTCPWAAWYNTLLLMKSMPKGVAFSFLCVFF